MRVVGSSRDTAQLIVLVERIVTTHSGNGLAISIMSWGAADYFTLGTAPEIDRTASFGYHNTGRASGRKLFWWSWAVKQEWGERHYPDMTPRASAQRVRWRRAAPSTREALLPKMLTQERVLCCQEGDCCRRNLLLSGFCLCCRWGSFEDVWPRVCYSVFRFFKTLATFCRRQVRKKTADDGNRRRCHRATALQNTALCSLRRWWCYWT